MAKTAIIQVRIDADDKQNAEELFDSMGTSLSEAIRLFIKQSIVEQRLIFVPYSIESKGRGKAFGALKAYASPAKIAKERQAWIASLAVTSQDREH